MKYNVFTNTRKNNHRVSKKITIVAAMLFSASMVAQQLPTESAIPVNSTPPTLQQHAW